MTEKTDLIPLTFVATNDLTGLTKGRLVPTAELTDGASTGWVPANLGIGVDGHIVDDIPFDSTGDLRLRPDAAATHRVVGIAGKPDVTVAFADVVNTDGTPWACCPRTLLRDAVADLADLGLGARVAFEHEFTDRDATTPHHPFSWSNFRAAEPVGSALVTAMERSGLEPENWLPEYGHHQYEVTVKPLPPVEAADRAILLRDLVRDVFAAEGRRATFTPMPAQGATGNGAHIHFGLQDADGGNALFDPARPGRLSELGGRFAAGVLKHARSMTALFAPLVVSYERLRPHQWSSAGVFLGLEDREALLRICPTVEMGGADPSGQFHLEFRGGDAGANPWLVLTVLLRAGIEGIRAGLEPADVSIGEPAEGTVPQLPSHLGEALDLLEADETVTGWLGADLAATYLRVKRVEVANMHPLDVAERCACYADVF